LLKDGLSFHTLQPIGEKRFCVHVFASDNATVDAVDKASAEFDVIPEYVLGDGESSAPRRKMAQIESNAMMQENNTKKSSEPLRIPAHWKDKTSERLGTKFAITGVSPKQAAEHQSTPDPDIPPTRD
jgi:hypothetical protein